MDYTVKTAIKRGRRGSTRVAAWAVHLLTASGALWGLLALAAIDLGQLRTAFFWMALALLVDGIDGPLARVVGVRSVLASIDGALLDNLVDFLNYVVVPAYLILRTDLLPPGTGWIVCGAVCVLSAFQFAHVEAKPDGHTFRGFPSYWNVVAFYLVLLAPPPWVALLLVVSFSLMIFVPVRYVHPSRSPTLGRSTLVLTVAWGGVLLLLLWRYPEPIPWLLHISILYVFYYFVLSLIVTLRQP